MFTPINSSDTVNGNLNDSGAATHRESSAHSDRPATTIASTHLGRGDTTKKLIVKGKKRNSTAMASSNNKRRQISILNDDLQVRKDSMDVELDALIGQTLTPTNLENFTSAASKKRKVASQLDPTAILASASGGEMASSTAAKPVVVYCSRTSMDALDSTSLTTSVECAKASDGKGFTLYQGPSSTASFSSSIAFTKPVNDQPMLAGIELTKGSGETMSSSRRSARLKQVGESKTEVSRMFKSPEPIETLLVVDDAGIGANFRGFDMVELHESSESDTEIRSNTPPSRGYKLNTRAVDELEDYGGALLSDADKRALGRLVSCSNFPPPKYLC